MTLLKAVAVRLPRGLALAALLAGAPAARGQVLYDAAQNTLPSSQGWGYSYNPLAPQPTLGVTNGVLFLDTTASGSTQAGYGRAAPADLNRTNGFAVAFTARVNSESHASTNRAGFAVIALGSDKRGIELGFWTNSVWAQADTNTTLFTHAETAACNTATNFLDYVLSVGPTNYTLFVGGAVLLTGPIRDYTAFTGLVDPYETPNFLFFGDDTGSAQGAWTFKRYTLVLPPTLVGRSPGVITWTGVTNLNYSVLLTTNLAKPWQTVATVSSPTGACAYTNATPSTAKFLRVSYP
jgi:hypothetical protein